MNFSKQKQYTPEEKQHLIANLELEGPSKDPLLPVVPHCFAVTHRIRQFESWLADRLENFNIHQEGQVSRIPKQVRSMTMREFGEKYNGNVQAALRGVQKERLIAAGGEGSLGELDKDARKRKWMASQEEVGEGRDLAPKAPKNGQQCYLVFSLKFYLRISARLALTATPRKAGSSTGPGTAQRARLNAAGSKTPGTVSTPDLTSVTCTKTLAP